MSNVEKGLIVICCTFLIIFVVMALRIDALQSRVQPIAMKPVIFMVDGQECWADTYPVFTYRTKTQSVKIVITCDFDVMSYHFPAIERTQ